MTWWKKRKPAPAISAPHDLLAESEQRTAWQEEREREMIEQIRHAYRRRNAEMDKLPAFGTIGTCPACGGRDHVRTFKSVDAGFYFDSTPYNLMDVTCGSCGYPLGEEKAQNFTLPRWFRARRGLGFETILIDPDESEPSDVS